MFSRQMAGIYNAAFTPLLLTTVISKPCPKHAIILCSLRDRAFCILVEVEVGA